jgi:DNA-binding PadR family transcriptional regulator
MHEVSGMFEQAVLIVVDCHGPGIDGRTVTEEVRRRLRTKVFEGAVHATLQRLLGKELISAMKEPGMRPGRPRQKYSITPEGRRALSMARMRLRRIWRGFATRRDE